MIGENAKYIEKVHQTWNQKLVIVGAMVAFNLVNQEAFAKGAPLPLQLVMLAVPVMCIMLDAHLLEKTLQARIISHFIIKEFEDRGTTPPWCKTFWSISDTSRSKKPFHYLLRFWRPPKSGHTIDALVGMRSATTSIVSIVPTVLVILLAAYAISPKDRVFAFPVAGIISVIYFVVAYFVFVNLRRKVQTEQ
ncbi:hypothetical protein LOC67_27140 [Stieleria sp. JC731]|uniref:hypothetical protein n=1 Tax=Stieleria sp. JC731 TaxID=2894195 RepID=UPI001E3981C6|nr:hypothetical protein [Stieleria sp. JC731]MCC9604246.1 hypothetical protein [Stieleria sp. JC731]